mmetsp:Transcript_37277/g.98620  ORF Transcript_37277/g.98620 Transcript_37277/m.98620 type:complete len:165 (+) Transcript_37277:78-572(+)
MSYAQFDMFAPLSTVKPGMKQPRSSSTNASATSRKNKSQRCGVCGGLGHKARTCDMAAGKEAPGNSLAVLHDARDPKKDPRTVLAAYGLLALNGNMQQPMSALMRQQTQFAEPAQQQPSQNLPVQSVQAQLAFGSMTAPNEPCSPSGRLVQPWREPLSPRWLAT